MNFFVNNWYILVGIIAVLVVAIVFVVKFFKLPTDEQIENIKEWSKWAVAKAEKELKSGTGQLKLRMVYDMFVDKYPTTAKIVPFETFSNWVDESLEWLNNQLESNKKVKTWVGLKNENGDKKQTTN